MNEKKVNRITIITSVFVLLASLTFLTSYAKGLFTYSGSTGSAQKIASIESKINVSESEGNKNVSVTNKGTIPAKAELHIALKSKKEGVSEELVNKTKIVPGKGWTEKEVDGIKVFIYDKELKEGETTSEITLEKSDDVKLVATTILK